MKVPTGQSVQLDAPTAVLKAPVVHGVHVAAPGEEYAPGGQTVALMEERGQYDPAGQRTGAPEEQ